MLAQCRQLIAVLQKLSLLCFIQWITGGNMSGLISSQTGRFPLYRVVSLALVAATSGLTACGGTVPATPEESIEIADVEQAACSGSAGTCGTVLTTMDGQSAYSNGAYQGTGTSCTTPDYQNYYGERYQCVEFAP